MRYLVIPFIAATCFGCADTYKWYIEDFSMLYINNWNGSFPNNITDKKDTVKTVFKGESSRESDYRFKLFLPPYAEGNDYSIQRRIVSSKPDGYKGRTGTLYLYESETDQVGKEITDGIIKAVPGDSIRLRFVPFTPPPDTSEYTVALKIVPLDLEGRLDEEKVNTSTNKIELYVVRNFAPVALFIDVPDPDNTNAHIYIFDATASNDRVGPQRYWGTIKSYTYSIMYGSATPEKIISQNAKAYYAFPASGTYVVSLVVNDNDGGSSTAYLQTIVIQ